MGVEVFLGLGSNIGLCSNNLQNAIAAIIENKGIRLIRQSKVYETQPLEFPHQPWFHNQVILVDVFESLTPRRLLNLLKDIETRMGRTRSSSKGPRIIDLDILTYGNMVIAEQGLRIPHVSIKNRAFVLVPMMDICPDFVFPDGECLKKIIDKLEFKLEENRICQQS